MIPAVESPPTWFVVFLPRDAHSGWTLDAQQLEGSAWSVQVPDNPEVHRHLFDVAIAEFEQRNSLATWQSMARYYYAVPGEPT